MIAVDVDLRKITAVTEDTVLHDRADLGPTYLTYAMRPPKGSKILCEIAGPVMHSADGRDACPPGKRRWMLYNAAWIGALNESARGIGVEVLVATSTAWTKGYKEAQRHSIAGMDPLKYTKAGHPVYKYSHDVREAFCMLHFYALDPSVWKPLSQYMAEL